MVHVPPVVRERSLLVRGEFSHLYFQLIKSETYRAQLTQHLEKMC